jgi:hypothetical protein
MKIIQIQVLPYVEFDRTTCYPRMVAPTDDGRIFERFEINDTWQGWQEVDAPPPNAQADRAGGKDHKNGK